MKKPKFDWLGKKVFIVRKEEIWNKDTKDFHGRKYDFRIEFYDEFYIDEVFLHQSGEWTFHCFSPRCQYNDLRVSSDEIFFDKESALKKCEEIYSEISSNKKAE